MRGRPNRSGTVLQINEIPSAVVLLLHGTRLTEKSAGRTLEAASPSASDHSATGGIEWLLAGWPEALNVSDEDDGLS
jgi:hypothetical protein